MVFWVSYLPLSTSLSTMTSSYTRQVLLHIRHNMPHSKLPLEAWKTMVSLGVNYVRPTMRGTSSGKRVQRPIQTIQPQTSRFKVRRPMQHGCNVNNLVPLVKSTKTKPTSTSEKSITACNLNAQSVNNKTLSIAYFIIDRNTDVVTLTETWLKSATD